MSIISDVMDRLFRNEDRFHRVVNGDSQTVVETDNGELPSLAKLVADRIAEINQFIPLMETKQDLDEKDAPNGYVGLGSDYSIRLKNSDGTITSWLTNLFTAPRTIALPNDSGTLALTKNIPAVETEETLLQKLGASKLKGSNSGDQTLESLGAQPKLGYVPVDVRAIGVTLAPLDDNEKIPLEYLPDSSKSVILFNSKANFPAEGEIDKIYIDRTTKFPYFWNADTEEYDPTGVDLPDTDQMTEGETNLFFATTRVLSTTLEGFSLLNKSGDLSLTDKIVDAFGKIQVQLITIRDRFIQYARLDGATFVGQITVPTVTTNVDKTDAVNVTALRAALVPVNEALGTRELTSNKTADIANATLEQYPNAFAVRTYVDQFLVGVLKDRGTHSVPTSPMAYPTTGGSGVGGAIMKSDFWYLSVTTAGTAGPDGKEVNTGDSIRALVDNPGQDPTKWASLEGNIGYVPVNLATKNKASGFPGLDSSGRLMISSAGGVLIGRIASLSTGDVYDYTLPAKSGTFAMVADVTDAQTALQTQITALKGRVDVAAYDIGGGFVGKPAASELCLMLYSLRALTINATGGRGFVNTVPTSTFVVQFTKNGSVFATLTVAAGANNGPIVTTGGVNVDVAVSDIIRAVAPATQDGTAADITFALSAFVKAA